MAGIKSLALRGIRSFGPEDCDEQRISFEKPLTLILGQNGCGKTTIIECLRYAVTGQMPPGSRNECFVHDAKVSRTTEVLGQVKLKMVNAKDKQLEISRSMRVTALAKKKSKFQTLDSFLSVIDETGNVKDISSRCADLDNMVQEELGVSKAIINSVIFCHQEDSSWPLDEGKKVKERFDEIFDADKYSDCFDRLRKIRKDYSTNIKLLTQEVAFLTEQKTELDKKKLDVVNTESRISESELKVSELSSELKPVTEKLTAIETLQKNLVMLESKREKIKGRLENCKTQEEELKKAIKTLFEGTTEELQETITNYNTTSKAKKKELDDSHKKIFSFNKEEEKMANEMSSNEIKFNKLTLLESQNQERIDSKFKMIVATALLAEIEMEAIENEGAAAEGIKTVTEKIASLRKEMKEAITAADAEESKVQQLVNEAREALSGHKQKISGKESEIQKTNKEMTKLNKEITLATDSKQKLEVMEEKFKAAEEEYAVQESSLNVEECQKEINDDEKEMEQAEQEAEDLNTKITQVQKQSAKLKERDLKEENLKSKDKQMDVLKNKHRSVITELLGQMPEKGFAISINKLEVEVRRELDGLKKKLKAKQIEVTKLEAERTHVRELLKDRRAELTAAEDQMYKACGSQTYDATLAKLSATVEKLQEDQNLLQSSLFIIRKYKEQLSENNCCPLCNRGFDAQNEVTDLISDLTTKVLNVPSKLEKVTEELQKSKAKKDDLLGLKTLNEKITALKEKDIPQLEKRLADVTKKIADVNEEIEESNTSMTEPERKMQQAKSIQGEMPLLDRLIKEVDAATRDFEAIKVQCAGFDTEFNLDEATTKQSGLRTKISTLRSKIKTNRTKLNAHTKKLQTMMDKKNKMKEDMLNMQKKVQEIVNLQENLKQLEENLEKLKAELEELKAAKPQLDEALKEKEGQKKELVAKHRSEIDVKRSFINKIEASFEKVKGIEKEIKAHIDRNVPKEMEKIKESNEKLMEKKMQIMKDRDEVTKRIDVLKDELAKQEINKRDLEDNQKLRKAQAEAEACTKEIAEIEEKLSGMNMDSISEKEGLIQKQTQLFREKAQTEGRLKELKERLKFLKADLLRSQNKELEARYREKFYDLAITKAIDKDIRDYSMALEKCVMEYHREKMENINLIIREMWRKIYRGNDIDYIEIKTEGNMNADSDRRKYDYRVVQCKNGVEIDMRGRCSAGQKVLACLIIRLALAETFSSRFGILALDEPTTNLDQDNVTSLCGALGEIVQERMKQRNFMFIIITHDKEFIESLGNVDKVSHYYEVSRNDEGKSRIKKIRFT